MPRAFQYAFLFAALALRLLLLTVWWRRNQWLRFPWFAGYIGYEMVRTLALLSIDRVNQNALYFYVYWTGEGLAVLWQFLVVRELYVDLFAAKLRLERLGVNLLQIALVAAMFLAMLAAHAAPGNDANKLVAAILVLQRAFSVVLIVALGFLLSFRKLVGLGWEPQPYGIAAGLLFYSSIEFALAVIRSIYGRSANVFYRWGIASAGLVQISIWIACMLWVHKENPPPDAPASEDIGAMQQAIEVMLQR